MIVGIVVILIVLLVVGKMVYDRQIFNKNNLFTGEMTTEAENLVDQWVRENGTLILTSEPNGSNITQVVSESTTTTNTNKPKKKRVKKIQRDS